MEQRHPCPACGFRVLARGPGSMETCPVCGWIDDLEQLVHPDFVVGANSGVSLRQAQARAASSTHGSATRDPAWRPLRPGEEPASGRASSPVCYLGTPEEEDFEPYWLA